MGRDKPSLENAVITAVSTTPGHNHNFVRGEVVALPNYITPTRGKIIVTATPWLVNGIPFVLVDLGQGDVVALKAEDVKRVPMHECPNCECTNVDSVT